MLTLAIDQSTSATKAMVFDEQGALLCRSDIPHRQITNEAGWVEHDPEEIFGNTLAACRQAVLAHGIAGRAIGAVGISNQRETAVCWDRATGRPVYPAIVWQCGRARDITDALAGHADEVRRATGLSLSPFFSAAKFSWIVRNVPEAADLLRQGRLCCGTVDAWLLFRLTGGREFMTDYSNASRTQLLNLDTLDWDDGMISLFGLDRAALPEVCMSDSRFGETTLGGLLGRPVPIHAMMGDSQAALYANGCHLPHAAKATFGSGTSVMMNAGGARPRAASPGVVESLAWGIGGAVTYVLEGNINFSGAVVSWLKDGLGLIASAAESERLAMEAGSANGVYLVPAFTGLSAPYWRNDVRAMLCGMGTSTKREHIVRAALESIAYQIKDIAGELEASCGRPLSELCADGGAARNGFLMQFTADMLGCRLRISETEELSAAGAAYLAAISAGLSDRDTVFTGVRHRAVEPEMPEEQRKTLYNGWKRSVSMLLKG